MVNYFQHLLKVHRGDFWYWNNKENFDSILKSTKKKSKKHPFHDRRVNFERGCRMNGERGTNVKYSLQHDNIHIVKCLFIDKQKWFQEQVKVARTCDATGFKCLFMLYKFFYLKSETHKARRVIRKCCLYLHNSHHCFINMYIYTDKYQYTYTHPYTYRHTYIYIYIYIYIIHIHIYFVIIHLFVDPLNVYTDFLFERKI